MFIWITGSFIVRTFASVSIAAPLSQKTTASITPSAVGSR
jgi:hypothetical protein